MKVVWAPEAVQDRLDIWDYIAADNPQAAFELDELFSAAITRLAEYPQLGRPGSIPGTCELILHASYRLLYEINDETLWVLAIIHTAQQWPPVQS